MHRSGFEKDIQIILKRKKISFEYEPFKLDYTIKASYLPDFKFNTKSGGYFLVEAKGYFSATDRRKLKAVKKDNPTLDIRLLFQRDNYLTKAKTTTYSQWATKNGFKWAIGPELPIKWLKEIKTS